MNDVFEHILFFRAVPFLDFGTVPSWKARTDRSSSLCSFWWNRNVLWCFLGTKWSFIAKRGTNCSKLLICSGPNWSLMDNFGTIVPKNVCPVVYAVSFVVIFLCFALFCFCCCFYWFFFGFFFVVVAVFSCSFHSVIWFRSLFLPLFFLCVFLCLFVLFCFILFFSLVLLRLSVSHLVIFCLMTKNNAFNFWGGVIIVFQN